MKILNIVDAQQVSGGITGYTMDVTLNVPSSQSLAMSNLFQQVITGQIQNATDFMNAMQQALMNGLDFNAVKISDINFSHF